MLQSVSSLRSERPHFSCIAFINDSIIPLYVVSFAVVQNLVSMGPLGYQPNSSSKTPSGEGGSLARLLSSLLVQEIVSQVIVSCRLGTTKKRGTKRSMVGSTRRDRRRDALYNFSFKLTVFVNDWLSSPRLRLKIVL